VNIDTEVGAEMSLIGITAAGHLNDAVALGSQRARQMSANEATGARDQNIHRRSLGTLRDRISLGLVHGMR
jgi:hypothetical protein